MFYRKYGAILGVVVNSFYFSGMPVYAQSAAYPDNYRDFLQSPDNQEQMIAACAQAAQRSELWDGYGSQSCQCFVDGLVHDIPDEALSAFFQNPRNQRRWPPVVTNLLADCVVAVLRTDQGFSHVMDQCATHFPRSQQLTAEQVDLACQCSYEVMFNSQASSETISSMLLGGHYNWPATLQTDVEDCIQQNQ